MAERAITNVEAGVAAKALIDHFFHNDAPKPNIRIPATEEDTDLVLTRYIKQQAARDTAIGELVKAAEDLKERADRARAILQNQNAGNWGMLDTLEIHNALAALKAVQHG